MTFGMGINLVKYGAKNHIVRSSIGVFIHDGDEVDYFYN